MPRTRPAPNARKRRHAHGLRRSRRVEPAVEPRSDPAPDPGSAVGAGARGADPAGAIARCLARRSLWADANGARWRAASPSCSGRIAAFCARATARNCPAIAGCISTLPIWCVRRKAATKFSTIVRRRLPGRDILSKTGSFYRARCRRRIANARCSGSRRSSGRCGIRCFLSRPPTGQIRASCC